mgnify:CR=1 FL=1
MILADKIISLRKKAGWSQEELAQQLGVSRQSVSKWEGAQSIPDISKILQMSRLFGVTTDFLLKDELEEAEYAPETAQPALRRVTMEQASRYLELRRQAAPRMALATFLCIISPVALLMLAAGGILGMDVKNGWKIFRRDRYNHASPNSAQTESVCAGALGIQLAGDASYFGKVVKKPYIGDPKRQVEYEDIRRVNRLMNRTAWICELLCMGILTWVAAGCGWL